MFRTSKTPGQWDGSEGSCHARLDDRSCLVQLRPGPGASWLGGLCAPSTCSPNAPPGVASQRGTYRLWGRSLQLGNGNHYAAGRCELASSMGMQPFRKGSLHQVILSHIRLRGTKCDGIWFGISTSRDLFKMLVMPVPPSPLARGHFPPRGADNRYQSFRRQEVEDVQTTSTRTVHRLDSILLSWWSNRVNWGRVGDRKIGDSRCRSPRPICISIPCTP